ncbi:MAG: glycosyltransferase [Saprospiraceae bacterium]|jgi:glycosyltransferase involved in cell wall biosynthesis|nr:glycosyltransferase [Saprospiraceae bacterium]MBK8154369.1 glycosyltransferase [Saprospiraceae bacterium]MBX7162469.1 glycosyltransferase [Saprospiraceae bacterium]
MSKIVIVGPTHPLRGGLASFNERLAREFKKSGDEVLIYTFAYQYPSFLFPGTSQYSSEPAPSDIDIRVKINSVNPLNWFAVGKELNKLRADILIVRYWLPFMGPCLGTILRQVRKNNHTKIICIADNIIPHEKRLGDHAFTSYFLKPVHACITMSEKVMEDLRKLRPDIPATIVDHPLYDGFGESISKVEARRHLKLGTEEKIMLFFGFIRKYKGLDILLEAMSNEALTLSGIKLLIAGEYYESAEPYQKMIEANSLSTRIYDHSHFIPDSDIKYYLSAADVVVQPYRSATQSGVTPLAYHFEVPMIVTDVGSLPRLVPHGKVGLVCKADANSLAACIVDFFAYPQDYFLPQIRIEKTKLSWEKLRQKILNLAYDI